LLAFPVVATEQGHVRKEQPLHLRTKVKVMVKVNVIVKKSYVQVIVQGHTSRSYVKVMCKGHMSRSCVKVICKGVIFLGHCYSKVKVIVEGHL
jgi:hypothetical protein